MSEDKPSESSPADGGDGKAVPPPADNDGAPIANNDAVVPPPAPPQLPPVPTATNPIDDSVKTEESGDDQTAVVDAGSNTNNSEQKEVEAGEAETEAASAPTSQGDAQIMSVAAPAAAAVEEPSSAPDVMADLMGIDTKKVKEEEVVSPKVDAASGSCCTIS